MTGVANYKPRWVARKEDAADNASRELPRLVSQFFAETREALAEPRTPRRLHQLRLASKKLRYTL